MNRERPGDRWETVAVFLFALLPVPLYFFEELYRFQWSVFVGFLVVWGVAWWSCLFRGMLLNERAGVAVLLEEEKRVRQRRSDGYIALTGVFLVTCLFVLALCADGIIGFWGFVVSTVPLVFCYIQAGRLDRGDDPDVG